jgi:hypothetical protein
MSSLGIGSDTEHRFADMGFTSAKLILMVAATVIGGTVARLLCQYKWLPALLIALCMTAQLYDPSATFAVGFPHDRYIGQLIMLFISATFGQSLARFSQITETSERYKCHNDSSR